jgi:hypothetical protein
MREMTYRNQIKVSSQDLQAALAGRKTCTIRAGLANVAADEIDLTDGQARARVKVVEVDTSKKFGELTQREVVGEGFATREELQQDLLQYYRALRADDPLTVIWFELL